jgi:hypothetical protein
MIEKLDLKELQRDGSLNDEDHLQNLLQVAAEREQIGY